MTPAIISRPLCIHLIHSYQRFFTVFYVSPYTCAPLLVISIMIFFMAIGIDKSKDDNKSVLRIHGLSWSGPDLLCNPRRDSDHPILQRCIRKAAEADYPPDGVLLRSTGQTKAVGIRPPSMQPCDMPVPDPTNTLHH